MQRLLESRRGAATDDEHRRNRMRSKVSCQTTHGSSYTFIFESGNRFPCKSRFDRLTANTGYYLRAASRPLLPPYGSNQKAIHERMMALVRGRTFSFHHEYGTGLPLYMIYLAVDSTKPIIDFCWAAVRGYVLEMVLASSIRKESWRAEEERVGQNHLH
jgi:hypothetical protein